MVTGASTADLAVVLIDARKGVVQQSRRHAFLASLLRVPHLVVAVNKMDLVGFDEGVFGAIVDEFSAFATKLEVSDVAFLPISALRGDNVVERSAAMPWYEGPPLLYHLEHVHIASDRNLIDPRLPVQWVIREGEDRGYAGQVAGGVWRPGDEVLVLPSGARSRVRGIETLDGPLDEAFPPMSVTVRLEDELDVGRGDLLCRPSNRPEVARDLDATVCWMDDAPARAGGRYLLKQTTRTTPCVLAEVRHRIDVDTLHHDASASTLALNEIGRVALRTGTPLAFDPYRRNRATGSFVLVDEATNGTVAAGMLLGPAERQAGRSADVVWQREALSREERRQALGFRGATVWMTGLPASGKSTLAGAVERALVERGHPAYRLDGDNLRHGLNADLGFDPDDRAENVRRTAHAARLLADAGTIAVVSLVSPYLADRELARALHAEAALPFLEVWLDTPLELCEHRDPKGLYARARRGELLGLTGVDDPYEPPPRPEVAIRPGPLDEAVAHVLAALEAQGALEGP
jgi:bifunctional enzyme CysN/CysC